MGKISVKLIALAALLFFCGGAFAAIDSNGFDPNGFDPNGYVVDDGLLYKVEARGQKTQVEGAWIVEEATEGGIIYWLAVDSENELYKGWKGGIYFFGKDGKFTSMLEKGNAEMIYLTFCPDGEQFVLSSGTYVEHVYELYEFKGLKLKKAFDGMALVWIDNTRFFFTYIDESKGARHEGADITGWFSVVVYDSAADLLTTVAEATKTEDFMTGEFIKEAGELVVMKISVKNEEDWADEEKHEVEETRVPVPPAG